MSPLGGADPKELEAFPEMSSSDLDAMSGPCSWDGFQGLDLAEPGGGVQM